MGTVAKLTLAFVLVSLVFKKLYEYLVFLLKSNWKYKFLDSLAGYIYYGPDIGVDKSLALDCPTPQVLERRRRGQEYLSSKLGCFAEDQVQRGRDLSSKLVDCRFSLAKVVFPLLRELEFPSTQNFITQVETDEGMHRVVMENGDKLLYLGNDAVNTLGVKSFYEPIQEEINRRMSLLGENQSRLRFSPIALNPELERNTELILSLTGMDQVRYALSGSEAMDAAFKDVRASCRGKEWIVRFKSAYHGHTSGVDFLNGQKQIFLDECDPRSLKFIQDYHYRIAAVVVNPMQHFTGVNKPSPPGEKLTAGKRIRSAVPKDDYARWLHSIADTCKYCSRYLTKIAFIVDDIYFAFRTPELFSTKYFLHPETGAPLRPDVLVLGKGVAAGYPLSMVLGRSGYLNSYDKKFLLQVNKTVGTLSAWYGGIVASNVFLEAVSGNYHTLQVKLPVTAEEQLRTMIKRFDNFTLNLNQRFEEKELPVRIRSFSNTFSIDYLSDSLYNSRYPQYLIAEGIYFGNYSTGKFNINADATDEDLNLLSNKFIAAAVRMKEDGYFEPNCHKLRMCMTLAYRFYVNFVRLYYDQMMEDKRIDIEVSHNHPVNKFGHFWSSVGQLVLAYPWCFYFGETIKGCLAFFFTHVIRQSGHFFYEHQDRDIEKLKFGHKDGSKKMAVVFIAVAGLIYYHRSYVWQLFENYNMNLSMSEYMSLVALFTIVPHFVEITHEFGYLRGLEWIIKILTDPLTDLYDFYDYWIIDLKYFLDFKDPKAVYKLDLTTKKIIKVN